MMWLCRHKPQPAPPSPRQRPKNRRGLIARGSATRPKVLRCLADGDAIDAKHTVMDMEHDHLDGVD
jgi:hypothetical protein